MTSNETVENMTDELKSLGGRLHARAVLTAEEIHNLSHVLETKAEDILAAHKREINSLIEQFHADLVDSSFKVMADERRVTDSVIMSLRDENQTKDNELAKLRALVNEMA